MCVQNIKIYYGSRIDEFSISMCASEDGEGKCYSPWEKCINSLAKTSKVNFEKHIYEITILRENFSAAFLYFYLLVQLRGRRGKQNPHTNVFVQQNREKHILEACFLPSTLTDSIVLL